MWKEKPIMYNGEEMTQTVSTLRSGWCFENCNLFKLSRMEAKAREQRVKKRNSGKESFKEPTEKRRRQRLNRH
jgi:hypothetical protein